jgi:hypothetical protein
MYIAFTFGAVFIACVTLAMIFPDYLSWFGVCWFISWSTVVLLVILSPVPNCPACHNALDQGLGDYCPECGARHASAWRLVHAPSCLSCGKIISRRRGRQYKIRACTHCGVPLDDKGL